METYDEKNKYAELKVVYFKIDGTYFMDVTAGRLLKDKEESGNSYWGVGVTFVHALCKIDIGKNKLTIIPLDSGWFTDRIKDGTLNLPYVKSTAEDGNEIFTATPEEWVTFLKKYKDSKDVFNPKYKFVLTRNK